MDATSPAPRTWIGLLRGVNVGGNTIRSADLVAAIEAAGFSRVKAVLASGNVLVEAPAGGGSIDAERNAVRQRLEAAVDERFGYGVAIAVVSSEELAAVIAGYPFEEVPERHPYVMFATDRRLLTRLAADAGEQVVSVGGSSSSGNGAGERLAMGDGVLYWEVAKGSSTDSPFAKLSSRAAYRNGPEAVTTRNLRTLRKLVW